jgi:hypothetical protein
LGDEGGSLLACATGFLGYRWRPLSKVTAIADTKIKTKVDARVLVHLLQADLVWEARASAKSRDLCLALHERMFYVRLRALRRQAGDGLSRLSGGL